MKTLLFSSSMLFCVVVFAQADSISGTVTDSASGNPVYHVKVGTDSAHTVLTDSAGKFSFNTSGTGTINGQTQQSRRFTWNMEQGTFIWGGNSGDVSIQVRNLNGALVSQYSSGKVDADTKLSIAALPYGLYVATIRCAGRTMVQKIMNGKSNSTFSVQLGGQNGAISGGGLTKVTAALATTALNFAKMSYFPVTKTYTGDQSGLVIKLQQNFTASRWDYLYAGEWQGGEAPGTQKMYIVRGGKTVWTYTEPLICEYDDTWMLSNGAILMSERHGAREIKSEKDTTTTWFTYQNVTGPGQQGELHVSQPIGLDKVFIVRNFGTSAKGYIINTKTGDSLRIWKIPTNPTNTSPHMNFRHCRITKNGTMLCAHMDWGRVCEYDTSNMKLLWVDSTNVGVNPWAAVLLHNGDILVAGNADGWVREITRSHQLVMDIKLSTLAGVTAGKFVQEVSRLANGNTIVSYNGGTPEIMEISQTGTTTGKVVWSVNNLGMGTDFQVLDSDQGVPENPGDLER